MKDTNLIFHRLLHRGLLLRMQAERAGCRRTLAASTDPRVAPDLRPTPEEATDSARRLEELDALISVERDAHDALAARMRDRSGDIIGAMAERWSLSADEADLFEALAALVVDPSVSDAIDNATGWRARWGRRTPGLLELLADGDPDREYELMKLLDMNGRLVRAGVVTPPDLEPLGSGEDVVARRVEITAACMATVLELELFSGDRGVPQ